MIEILNYSMCIIKLTSYLQLQDKVDFELYSLVKLGLPDVTGEVFKRQEKINARIEKVCHTLFDAYGFKRNNLEARKKSRRHSGASPIRMSGLLQRE